MEKLLFPSGNLGVDITFFVQVSRGKGGRSAEYAAAMATIRANVTKIEGEFSNWCTKFLPIMITETTDTGNSHDRQPVLINDLFIFPSVRGAAKHCLNGQRSLTDLGMNMDDCRFAKHPDEENIYERTICQTKRIGS